MSKISSPLIQKIFDQEIFRYSTQLLTFPNSISMHASKSTFHNLPDQNLHELIVRDEKEMILSLRNFYQLHIKTYNKETGKHWNISLVIPYPHSSQLSHPLLRNVIKSLKENFSSLTFGSTGKRLNTL